MSKRSKYDAFFERFENHGKCKKCGVNIGWSTLSGTNGVRKHLIQSHPEDYKSVEDSENQIKKRREDIEKKKSSQAAIPFPVDKKISLKVSQESNLLKFGNSKKSENVDEAIMKMICADVLPFSIVEKDGFLHFLKQVAPNYKPKGRNFYAQNALPSLDAKMKSVVKEDLKTMKEISITSDGWSSADKKHSLLSVTGHWIDNVTFQPKWAVLGAKTVKGLHNSDNFCNLIKETLKSYDIHEKSVISLTRDGASVMEALARKLNMKSFHCYAHLLQLAVDDFLKTIPNINDLVKKMKKITRRLHRSEVCRSDFERLLNEENLPQIMLKKSTEVRWSSLFYMIESFIKTKKAVLLLSDNFPQHEFPCIDRVEWLQLENVLKILQPVEQTTKRIQHRVYCPASVIIPSVRLLTHKLDQMIEKKIAPEEDLEGFKDIIKQRTVGYSVNFDLKTSTFLDPRFKDSFFEESHSAHVIDLLECEFGEGKSNEESETVLSDSDGDDEPSLYASFLKKYTKPVSSKTEQNSKFRQEVSAYLNVPPNDFLNPFEFWSSTEEFPHLKLLARRFLSMPSTSCESERLFSVSGLICSSKRRPTQH